MAKSTPAPLPSASYHYIRRLFSRPPQRRGWRNARRQTACRNCGQHEARYHYRRRVAWRRDHDLCPSCYRSYSDRLRARQLREGRWLFPACLSGGAR